MKLLFKHCVWIVAMMGFPEIASSQSNDTPLVERISTTIANEFQTESSNPPVPPVRDFSLEGTWSTGANVIPTARYYAGSVAYTRNDTTWLYVFGGDTVSVPGRAH
ncbi:MAG: hypothetical protein AAB393_06045, partial [Bacteroidota bacterium]